MKKSVIAFIVLLGSIIGISPATAVTACPSGTIVSTTNISNCISSIASYIPTDVASSKICNSGDTLNSTTGKCDIPSKTIPAGATYKGIPVYSYSCPTGSVFSENNSSTVHECKTNPGYKAPIYSPGTDCSQSDLWATAYPTSFWYYGADNMCHIGAHYTTTKDPDSGIFQTCSTDTTRQGAYCVYSLTPVYFAATSTIATYYCNAVLNSDGTIGTYYNSYSQSTIDCVGSSSTVQTFPSYTPLLTYTGTCSPYHTFSKTDGKCYAYSFSPDIPATSLSTLYQCAETQYMLGTKTTYYAYDASVLSPFGVSRTCVPVTTTITTTSSTSDGVYLCVSVSQTSNNIIYFVSDTDKTGTSSTLITSCDFTTNEESTADTLDTFIYYGTTSNCDIYNDYKDWLACETAKLI